MIDGERQGAALRDDPRIDRSHREPPAEHLGTAHLRRLPDFLIIGAQRGGTTSLFHHLSAHPDVGPTWRKEIHFFDRETVYREKGVEWYRAHFPLSGEVRVVGEATPSYLYHPSAPERALDTVPNAKLIAILRNPVDRAYSHYQMQKRRGIETLSFEEAIEREHERRAPGDDDGSKYGLFAYAGNGRYLDHLARWMNLFPRERFLILKSEDMYEDAAPVLLETQTFLGVRPQLPNHFRARHVAEYGVMSQATRRRLTDHFASLNRDLYKFVGRNLDWDER